MAKKETNCPLAVWETECLTYHCRLDGKFCEVHGDWDRCRYNFRKLSIKKLQFMVDNGLGPEDMKDDITYP
jgi:hypothetical protein